MGALLIAGCLLYNFLRPSPLAYVGLAFLVLWYVYIPIQFVAAVWPLVQKIARPRKATATRVCGIS
jgi:hypothetical protein